MIRDRVDLVRHAGLHRLHVVVHPRRTEGAADQIGVGVSLAHGTRRVDVELSQRDRVGHRLPAVHTLRLVPYLIVLHAACEVLREGDAVVVPRLLFLACVDRRAADRAEDGLRLLAVQVVAVAEAHPRDHAAGDDVVHDGIDPVEVVPQ